MKKSGFQFFKVLFAATILFSFLWGCEKDNNDNTEISAITKKVNSFIYSYFQYYYLWNQYIPSGINPNTEPDPFDMFDKLVYSTYDKWSYLTDDAETMFKEYEGISTTYGLGLARGVFTGTDYYFAVVQFVYPDSPAEEAGVKRGDIIIGINNGYITADNYMDLYYSSSISISMGDYSINGIGANGVTISMNSREMYLDPIQDTTIIVKRDKKIGYLCYTDYVTESHDKLVQVFSDFKNKNVTDIVLDLRYNPGGAATTARYLSSILAPYSAIRNKSIFLKELWNNDRARSNNRNEYFNSEVGVNMDLSHLYVLTTGGTASASEATIIGLDPYVDVIRIGTTTYGKYCGASLIQPWIDDDGNVDPEIGNWAMALVVYKFANSNDYTDFTDGLTPNYEVEDIWYDYKPFGDESDPLLAKAIELITGETASERTRSVITGPAYRINPDMDGRKGGMIKPKK